MKRRIKRVLIGTSIAVAALAAMVAALTLLVFGGLYAFMLSTEWSYLEDYNPKEVHRIYMNAEKVVVTCKPLEIDYVDYDAEQVCGVMELDSWDLKFFARCESYHWETAITVWYGSCDYIVIYENDTANVHWLGSPRMYLLPEGTYQKVYELLPKLDALPGTGHPG